MLACMEGQSGVRQHNRRNKSTSSSQKPFSHLFRLFNGSAKVSLSVCLSKAKVLVTRAVL